MPLALVTVKFFQMQAQGLWHLISKPRAEFQEGEGGEFESQTTKHKTRQGAKGGKAGFEKEEC